MDVKRVRGLPMKNGRKVITLRADTNSPQRAMASQAEHTAYYQQPPVMAIPNLRSSRLPNALGQISSLSSHIQTLVSYVIASTGGRPLKAGEARKVYGRKVDRGAGETAQTVVHTFPAAAILLPTVCGCGGALEIGVRLGEEARPAMIALERAYLYGKVTVTLCRCIVCLNRPLSAACVVVWPFHGEHLLPSYALSQLWPTYSSYGAEAASFTHTSTGRFIRDTSPGSCGATDASSCSPVRKRL